MNAFKIKGASVDSFLLTLARILTTLTTMVSTKILSIGLSLDEYGTYSQATVVITIATSVLLLGLVDAINYFYNNHNSVDNEKKRISIVNTVFAIEAALGILFAIVLCVLRNDVGAYFENELLPHIVPLVALKPMIDNMLHFYQVLFVSSGKAKVIAFRNLIVVILKLLAIYLSVHVFSSIQTIFLLLIILDILQLIVMYFWYAKDGFFVNPFKGKVEYIAPIIKYGFPMAIYALTSMLTRSVDKLVIGRMADISAFAIYSNCSRILPFDIVSTSFAVVLMPYIMKYISQKERIKAAILFRNYLQIGYYSVWILGVAVLISSKQVICCLYSDEYLPGNAVFILYVLDSMLRFANMHLILTSDGKAKTLMMYSLTSLVLNGILSVLLYSVMGMIGPAVATLVVAMIYTFQVLNKSKKILKIGWSQVFDIKDLSRFVMVLLVTGVIFFWVNRVLLSCQTSKYLSLFVSSGAFVMANLLIHGKRIKKTLSELNAIK